MARESLVNASASRALPPSHRVCDDAVGRAARRLAAADDAAHRRAASVAQRAGGVDRFVSALGQRPVNGFALHAWVFPRLSGIATRIDCRLWPAAALGAISSASWVTASFVGVARVISPWLPFAGFMALYGAVIGVCLALAFAALRVPPLGTQS
jgi:hypothetical protein